MEQKAAQVLSQQEREQQTRDLKQQDTKLNALTKEKGNVPLIFKSCVVLFPPTGHIYLNLHLFCKDEQSPKKHTHYRKYKATKKKKRSTKKVNHRTANREATHRTICTQSTN